MFAAKTKYPTRENIHVVSCYYIHITVATISSKKNTFIIKKYTINIHTKIHILVYTLYLFIINAFFSEL